MTRITYKPEDYLPPCAPRIGNRVTRFIGRLLLRSMGYRIEGQYPDQKKMILIGSPHTSNWDLFIALGTIMSLGVRINFMMKKEAFFFPFKKLFIALGGIPVDRKNPKSVVKQVLRNFKENDAFWLALLPEGTRKPVTSWKPGFVRIARQAGVPILVMGLDARTKTLHLGKLVWPDENTKEKPAGSAIVQAEKIRIASKAKYSGVNPKNN